jgi:hypothetical protein
MIRVVLFISAVGVFVTSCNNSDKEAAISYCNCYAEIAEATAEITQGESNSEQPLLPKNFQEMADKAKACEKKWKEKYDGKIHLDRFEDEVRKTNEAVYNLAKSNGVF